MEDRGSMGVIVRERGGVSREDFRMPVLRLRFPQKAQTGLALVSALLVLAFLSLVGAAFLSTASLDVRIAENYSTQIRLRYLAEAGIAEARERIRASGKPLAWHLAQAAGPDQILETSLELAERLISDDQPILPADPARRDSGEPEAASFREAGAGWHVFMQNDVADGRSEATDTNGIVTLVSIAHAKERVHRVEADVMHNPPPVVAALTLAGSPGVTGLSQAGEFRIHGTDRCGGPAIHAVGLTRDEDAAAVAAEIPADRETRYTGAGPVPDVANVAGALPGSLLSVSGVEQLTRRLGHVATEIHAPSGGGPVRIGPIGSRADPRVVLVEGDAILVPGPGYGVLIVRGAAQVIDGFVWNGLVMVVGVGHLEWTAQGTVYGAVLVVRTLEGGAGPGPTTLPGPRLGEVGVDFDGAHGGIYYDSCVLDEAFRFLPVSPIAIRSF